MKYFSVAIPLLTAIGASAAPAFPLLQPVTQPDGSIVHMRLLGDEHAHVAADADGRLMEQDADGFWRPSAVEAKTRLSQITEIKRTSGRTASIRPSFPTKGEVRSLVILVDFPDINFVTPDVRREFTEMLNLKGFDRREHIGCAADYFRAQSSGQFSPVFDVYGPVRAARSATYYGENDANGDDMHVHELVLELCRSLDSEIDFSQYDADGDGLVDNIYLFYAGYGENFAGNKASWIWPHANHMSSLGISGSERTFDGVTVDSYGCCAELYGSSGADTSSIGTFCHEFGHILGLPDTYDVNYAADGTSDHPDQWDIMASGSYLPLTRNSGAVPAGYSAMERWLLGWSEPTELLLPQSAILTPLHLDGESLRISTSDPDEFFLLENRQNISGTYDRFLPYHGMLIWHVDRRKNATINVTIGSQQQTITCADAWNLGYNAVNMNATHQCLEIEKAAGNSGSKTTADTPFPGRQQITSFTDDTSPSMRSWDGTPTSGPITGISERDGNIYFDFCGGREEEVRVKALEAGEVTENGFTARWEESPYATLGYTLHLYGVTRGEPQETQTLSLYSTSALPDGWSADGDITFSPAYLTLGGGSAQATLTSPEIDMTPGASVTVRASLDADASTATVTVKAGDTILARYQPSVSTSNYVATVPPGTAPCRLSFTTERRKKVRIENISVTQMLAPVSYTPMEQWQTQQTSFYVTLPPEDSMERHGEYAYDVTADGYANSRSRKISVTPAASILYTAAPDDTETIYYTIDGRRINGVNPAPGIYIRVCGTKAEKIIIK